MSLLGYKSVSYGCTLVYDTHGNVFYDAPSVLCSSLTSRDVPYPGPFRRSCLSHSRLRDVHAPTNGLPIPQLSTRSISLVVSVATHSHSLDRTRTSKVCGVTRNLCPGPSFNSPYSISSSLVRSTVPVSTPYDLMVDSLNLI